MKVRVGILKTTYSARGIPSYSLEMWHDGLKKHRLIRGGESEVIRRKVELQVAEWEEKWRIAEAKEKERETKEGQKKHQEENKILAAQLTADAIKEQEALASILKATLSVNDAVDWDELRETTIFAERIPEKPEYPSRPRIPELPREPSQFDESYTPKLGILTRLIPSKRAAEIAACEEKFRRDHSNWTAAIAAAELEARRAVEDWNSTVAEIEASYNKAMEAREVRKSEYYKEQASANARIDAQREAYLAGEPQAIADYCDLVLSRSVYPDCFPKDFDLSFDQPSGRLIVDYALPAPADLPSIKSVRYVATRDEFEYQKLPETQLSKIYDDVLYQVTLRTIHEIFESDVIGAISVVVFNGYVTSIDKSNGKSVTACVLSLQASKEEFKPINLADVDPRACFKSLKGVGSSKLSGLAAVPPIVNLQREDSRFVEALNIASNIDVSTNLAAMDWEDFEHLIREIFEKEFAGSGGEVKVTQASRDGGVDAVVFDPDPLRGGKIVIQAKRYTNTVGVSAVRDLYGTVMNEGANKGILVTTSDFGPDSYAFANGKPLVLISGANLLFLLEKHGHKARIDIQEARNSWST